MSSASPPSLVLMTADSREGVWGHSLELARALAPHGVSVALATLGEPLDGAQRDEAARAPNVQVFESTYRLEWMEDPWQGVAEAGNWLLTLRDRLGPDLVHLNSYALAALPWGVPTVVTAHCCVLSWWSALRGSPAPPTWNRYRREVRRGLASADLVVAPTRTMLQCLQRHYGPLRAARWIALGRDPALFLPRAKQGYVLAGSLGDDPEGPSALDEAAWALPWPVFLLGDSGRVDGGPRFARPLGRLPLPMRAAWLARASVYVLPSSNAPGLSVLEAALAGCALVLGDVPSLREGWDGAAVFVDPDDATALTRAVRSLMDDAARGSFVAQRARAHALDLTPARMAREYLEAYALAGQTASARAGVSA